ncbi:MAG: hypothetical protein V4476_19535 [Pseudomonadota bacterium]
MSAISRAVPIGPPTPKSIINANSTSGWAAVGQFYLAGRVAQIVPGALTASVLKNVLSVTGPGSISKLIAMTTDATSRSIRVVLTLDGTVVFDSTSAAIVNANYGGIVIGASTEYSATPANVSADKVTFSKSMSIQVSSSNSEATGIVIGIQYTN